MRFHAPVILFFSVWRIRANLAFLEVAEAAGTVSTLAFCYNSQGGREVILELNDMLRIDEFRVLRNDLIRRYYPARLVEQYLELHSKPLPEYVWPES